MKQLLLLLFIAVFILACKNETEENELQFIPRTIKTIDIETVLQDSTLNVRAIEKVSGYNGFFFVSSTGKGGMVDSKEVVYPIEIDKANKKLNFRAFASTLNAGFALSIESPAYLYKIGKDDTKIVYQENHEKVFYDAIDFWNDQEGIAIGDSVDGCLSVIITRNGGNTWQKLPCKNLPKGLEKEGAFAASDTNIAIVGNKTWVATTAGRIYFSPDKGKTWSVTTTPIVSAKETEGIYSLAFYDALNGYGIGGDYTKAADSTANKIRTTDGGKTWQLVAENQSPGYRSCVQYIPGRQAKELVAIGFKGIDYSKDSGITWTHLSDEGFYTLRFLNDSVAYAAGNKRISKLIFKE